MNPEKKAAAPLVGAATFFFCARFSYRLLRLLLYRLAFFAFCGIM